MHSTLQAKVILASVCAGTLSAVLSEHAVQSDHQQARHDVTTKNAVAI